MGWAGGEGEWREKKIRGLRLIGNDSQGEKYTYFHYYNTRVSNSVKIRGLFIEAFVQYILCFCTIILSRVCPTTYWFIYKGNIRT